METVTKFSSSVGYDGSEIVWLTGTRQDLPLRCNLCSAMNWAKAHTGNWIIEDGNTGKLIYHIVTTG